MGTACASSQCKTFKMYEMTEERNQGMRLITDYLDNIAEKESEKVALADVDKTVTYGDLCDVAKRIASSIIATGTFRQPIAVIMDEGVDMIAAFLGVAESGNFYASIDATLPTKMKEERLSYLKPTIIITTDPAMTDICKKSCPEAETVFFSKLISANREENGIENVANLIIINKLAWAVYDKCKMDRIKELSEKGIKCINVMIPWDTDVTYFTEDEKLSYRLKIGRAHV